jgi:hypothetical protein
MFLSRAAAGDTGRPISVLIRLDNNYQSKETVSESTTPVACGSHARFPGGRDGSLGPERAVSDASD